MAKKDKKAKKDAAAEEEKEAPAEGAEAPAEGGAEGAEEGEKKSKKKLIIIVVAVVLLIAAGVGGAYFAGVFGGGEHAEGEGEHAEGEAGPTVYFELPEFLVNLNTGGRQTSFLKMTVSLELPNAADQAAVQANLPRVLDSFNTYLRELRATDLYGSAGTVRLREELLARVNKELEPVKVSNILFKQLVIQ